MCVTAAYQSLYASPQTPYLSLQRNTLCLSFTDTLDAHCILACNVLFFLFVIFFLFFSFCKIIVTLNGTNS